MKKKFEFEATRYDKKGGKFIGERGWPQNENSPPSTKKHRTSEG